MCIRDRPNDTTNEARALTLLEKNGFFKLKADAGLTATAKDIEENPQMCIRDRPSTMPSASARAVTSRVVPTPLTYWSQRSFRMNA